MHPKICGVQRNILTFSLGAPVHPTFSRSDVKLLFWLFVWLRMGKRLHHLRSLWRIKLYYFAHQRESKAHRRETVWSLVEMVALKKLISHLFKHKMIYQWYTYSETVTINVCSVFKSIVKKKNQNFNSWRVQNDVSTVMPEWSHRCVQEHDKTEYLIHNCEC